jgi:hypothetical protein
MGNALAGVASKGMLTLPRPDADSRLFIVPLYGIIP